MTTTSAMQIKHVDVESLRPAGPRQPSRISEADLEALTRSLREWGFIRPVRVWSEDRVVIGGHQRLLPRASSA